MKKTFSKVCGALLASALIFVGCSDITQGAKSSDTIIPLDKPDVTAIAYPGLIYYSWTAIPGADSYDVQILNNNIEAATDNANVKATSALFTTTTDGIEYTIRVSAHGTARAISTLSSEFGETKVTSIVPPTGTHALDFINYESTGKKNRKADKGDEEPAKALKAEDIKVLQNEDSVYVGFNGKAYLSYKVALDKDYDETQVSSLDAASVTGAVTVDKNNTEVKFDPEVLSAGTYTVNVKAFARTNTSKYIADMVTVADKVTYESFASRATVEKDYDNCGNGNEDGIAQYVEDVDGDKNVRVWWTPVEVMGKTVPTSYYKLYTKAANSIALTPVEATVVESQVWKEDKLTVVHYFDTTVADPTISNDFIIVLTNDGKYADSYSTISLKPNTSVTVKGSASISSGLGAVALDSDQKVNDIEWTITKAAETDKIVAVKLLSKDINYAIQPQIADFAASADLSSTAVKDDNDATKYVLKTKDLPAGQHFLMVVFDTDTTQELYMISSAVKVVPVTE